MRHALKTLQTELLRQQGELNNLIDAYKEFFWGDEKTSGVYNRPSLTEMQKAIAEQDCIVKEYERAIKILIACIN